MKLHQDRDVFEELVLATADGMGLPQAYVEKDYWVTKVLGNLASSEHHEDFVFKGGTSLSKVHGLIHRFSEDVDLAVCQPEGGSARLRRQLKAVEAEITKDLTYLPDHPGESKHGRFRKTFYEYPRLDGNASLGPASDELLLEINAMATPEPNSKGRVESLVAGHLSVSGNGDLVNRYELESFQLKVLDVNRTAAEKVIALVRASREGEDDRYLRSRIRHVYDLCMIFRHSEHAAYLENEGFREMLRAVCDADRKVFPQASEWLDPPLHEADLFADPSATWPRVSDEFQGRFAQLVYAGELPTSDEVIDLLSRLARILESL